MNIKKIFHIIRNKLKFYRRIGLKNKNVSIICNNCVGGYIMDFFGIRYNSPTEGLLIEEKDYIKFCCNIIYYFKKDLVFISPNESIHKDIYRSIENFGEYPIAKCGDIEIHFLHYKNEREALEKWNRRKKRIGKQVFFIFVETENTTIKDLINFDALMKGNNYKILTYNEKINGEHYLYSKEVSESSNHHWKPAIVLKIINWKEEINKLV